MYQVSSVWQQEKTCRRNEMRQTNETIRPCLFICYLYSEKSRRRASKELGESSDGI